MESEFEENGQGGNVIILTEEAEAKLRDLLEKEERDDLMLRVGVQPGGCSGLIYQMYFDTREIEGDQVQEYAGGVRVIIDRMSAPYIQGSKLDFVDALTGAGFTLDNPNVQSTCSCGQSFA